MLVKPELSGALQERLEVGFGQHGATSRFAQSAKPDQRVRLIALPLEP